MSYKYWKSREYMIEKKFQEAGFSRSERIPLSRNPLEHTSEDVIVPELNMIIDVKSTQGKKSIRIFKEDIEKIQDNGKKVGKVGSLIFSFKNDKNSYIILNLNDFFKILPNNPKT